MRTACGYGNCNHIARGVKAAQRHSERHPLRKPEVPAKGSLFTVRWDNRKGTISALVNSPKEDV